MIKGILEKIFDDFAIVNSPSDYMEILDEGIFFELNFSKLFTKINFNKSYKPIPKYPPIIEDLALLIDEKVQTGQIIEEIKKQSPLVVYVNLLDVFQDSRTFHIIYQHRERNLTTKEVAKIREKIIEALKKKFNIRLKE